jgi:hypothetical protein
MADGEKARVSSDQRSHWHLRATELAQLDCALLELISWDDRRLARLPTGIFAVLMPKLSELVDWACHQSTNFRKPEVIEFLMARAIWRLVKTLKPNLQPFGDY